MTWLPLWLFGCSLGGNTPPRFHFFNERKAKYLFGFAYLENPWIAEAVPSGARWTFSVDVSDANGDTLDILFPSAPGEIHFDTDTMTGYWDVPEDPLQDYATLQVLAVDEHGASDILFVELEISGAWDTGWDTSEEWYFTQPWLEGDIRVENRFLGQIDWMDPDHRCKITWSNVDGQEIAPCENCERSWQFQLTQGDAATSLPDCAESLTRLESTTHEIGWATAVEDNDMTFSNSILYHHPDSGWIPAGNGSLQQQRLQFTLKLP